MKKIIIDEKPNKALLDAFSLAKEKGLFTYEDLIEIIKIRKKQIFKKAESLMGQNAEKWINIKNPSLNNKSHAELVQTLEVLNEVENLLVKMEWGLP